jgi:hypothetical protein
MNATLSSLLIGIMVMLAIYLALSRVMDIANPSVKKALALFSAAVGLLATFWLRSHPNLLGHYTQEIVLAGLAIVIALLFLAHKLL